jgi:hypothetical protein
MTDPSDETIPGTSALKIAKMVVPWLLLAIVGARVWAVYGDYQAASVNYDALALTKPKSSLISTETAKTSKGSGTTKPAAKPVEQVEAVTDVNVHKDASASSATIWVMATGDRCVLVERVGPWFKVRNSKNAVGWVTSGNRYTKVVKAK